MGEGRTIASELRANFMDCLAYLVPGSVFLGTLVAGAAYFRDSAAIHAVVRTILASDGGVWSSVVAIAAFVAASYAVGMLVSVLDDLIRSCRSPRLMIRGFEIPGSGEMCGFWPLRPSHAVLVTLRKTAANAWDWHAADEAEEDALYGLAEALVEMKVEVHARWIERYSALQNFCGALAWSTVLATSALVLLGLREPLCCLPSHPWVVPAPLPALAFIAWLLLKSGQTTFSRLRAQVALYVAAHLLRSTEQPEAEKAPAEGEQGLVDGEQAPADG